MKIVGYTMMIVAFYALGYLLYAHITEHFTDGAYLKRFWLEFLVVIPLLLIGSWLFNRREKS